MRAVALISYPTSSIGEESILGPVMRAASQMLNHALTATPSAELTFLAELGRACLVVTVARQVLHGRESLLSEGFLILDRLFLVGDMVERNLGTHVIVPLAPLAQIFTGGSTGILLVKG